METKENHDLSLAEWIFMEEKSPDVVKWPRGTIIRQLSSAQELKDSMEIQETS